MTDQRITQETIRTALRFPEIYRTYRDQYAEPRGRAQLLDRQGQRLETLLRRITTGVPAFSGHRIGSDPFAALAGLPTMSKASILADPARHIADSFDPAACSAVLTSGTTGEPLRILHSPDHLIHRGALGIERMLGYGVPFDRNVLSPFMRGAGRWREHTSLLNGFTRVGQFGFLDDATSAERQAVAQRSAAFRPDALHSHPPRMAAFADLLAEAGIELQVPLLQTFGVNLTVAMRQSLESAFGGVVRDQYAMSETNMIAAECSRGRLHLEADRLWVEILDPDGTPVPRGTPGEVVVTNLLNDVMPFVRYRTGDVAALDAEPCPCGGSAPVLGRLAGRDHGLIEFTDGTTIQGLRVVRALEQLPLRQVQVVQRDPELLTILVTPLPGQQSPNWRELVRTRARAVVGDRIVLEISTAGPDDFLRPGGDKVVSFVPLSSPRQPSPGSATTREEVPNDEAGADRADRGRVADARGRDVTVSGPAR